MEPDKTLLAAFTWLLNHYDPKDGLPPMRAEKVTEIASRVLADYGPCGIEAYEEFRRRYFHAKV